MLTAYVWINGSAESALIKLTPNAVTKRAAQLNKNLRRETAVGRTDRAAHR